jgi:hypothetical protein
MVYRYKAKLIIKAESYIKLIRVIPVKKKIKKEKVLARPKKKKRTEDKDNNNKVIISLDESSGKE